MNGTAQTVIVDNAAANQRQHSSNEALLGAYEEICKSYHAIDEYRMKLLGLLPLASVAAIFLIGDGNSEVSQREISSELIGFISLVAAAFTLSLFLYEIRGTLRCDELIRRGQEIETEMGIKGQFYVCADEHNRSKQPRRLRDSMIKLFNAKVAACMTYSIVFTAWIFIALRFGLEWTPFGCATLAGIAGLVLAVGTYNLLNRLIAA